MFELRRSAWFSIVSLLVPVLLVATGCGGAGVVPVSGAVTLDGVALDGAAVSFVPDVAAGEEAPEGQTPASGQTDASGKFVLGSVAGAGAAPGKYKVGVSKLPPGAAGGGEVPKGAPPGTLLSGGAPPKPGSGPPKDMVPAKYVNPDTSEITVEVKSGMPPVTIDLKSS